jgi:hypothetical protein
MTVVDIGAALQESFDTIKKQNAFYLGGLSRRVCDACGWPAAFLNPSTGNQCFQEPMALNGWPIRRYGRVDRSENVIVAMRDRVM